MSLANVWGACADDLVVLIQGLSLEKRDGTTLPSTSIKRRDEAPFYERHDPLPLVLVVPRGKESYEGGSSEGSEGDGGEVWVGLPVTVVVLSAGDRDATGGGNLQLNWRQRILAVGPKVAYGGRVATVWRCKVEMEPVIPAGEAAHGWHTAQIVFRYTSTQPRRAA